MKTTTRSILLIALLAFCVEAPAQQKIAHVDIAAVMKALPEAQEAQRKLDALVDEWQRELERLQKNWEQKFKDYDKRKLILTDQGRANAERELQELDRNIADFRNKKFGQSGEIFTKEDELMRPIQDLVFDQVKNLALELGYDYVLDKSGGAMIYSPDAHDLTQKVIDRIEKTLPPRQVSGQQSQPLQPRMGTGTQPRDVPHEPPLPHGQAPDQKPDSDGSVSPRK